MSFEEYYKKLCDKYPSINKESFRIDSKGFKAILEQCYKHGKSEHTSTDNFIKNDPVGYLKNMWGIK